MSRVRSVPFENDDYFGPAVYRIRNKYNGDSYIGSASRYSMRIGGHMSLLRKGKHHSKRLQESFNKLGFDGFVFEIIEFASEYYSRVRKEHEWIFKLTPYYNSNIVLKERQRQSA